MHKQKGFSLIELLIVVAIILIIAAMSIPNLLRSRIAANEASAVGSLRTINTAEITYSATYPAAGFASDLYTLGPGTSGVIGPTNAALLDNVLGCTTAASACTKGGYKFTVSSNGTTPPYFYTANASPVKVDQTGHRYFYSDASAVIRYNLTAAASSGDMPLQ